MNQKQTKKQTDIIVGSINKNSLVAFTDFKCSYLNNLLDKVSKE